MPDANIDRERPSSAPPHKDDNQGTRIIAKSPNSKSTRLLIIVIVTPIILIVLLVAGLFLKVANDTRKELGLSVWQAVQQWQTESRREREGAKEKEKKWQDEQQQLWKTNPALARWNQSLHEERDPDRGRIGWGTLAKVLVFGTVSYVFPSLIAFGRDHPQKQAIAVLNLVAGWSGIGWIIALVWAFTNPVQAKLNQT